MSRGTGSGVLTRPKGAQRQSTILIILLVASLALPFSLVQDQMSQASPSGRFGKPDFDFRVSSATQNVDTPQNYEYGTIQITLSEDEPIEGVTVVINATIFNTGTAEGTVDVSFFDGHPAQNDLIGIDTLTIKALRYDTAMSWWNTSNEIENHTIWVVIDLNNTVDEETENNNNATKDVVIDIIPVVQLVRVDGLKEPIYEDYIFNLSVGVTDTSSDINAGFQFNWSFDDPFGNATNPSEVNGWNITDISHSYVKEGTYNVTLQITDDGGASAWDNMSVMVKNAIPIAEFTWCPNEDPTDCDLYEGSPIRFDASDSWDTPSDKVSLKYKWDFGDNERTDFLDDATVIKEYSAPGTYPVWLTVRDDDGLDASTAYELQIYNMHPMVELGPGFSVNEDDPFHLKAIVNDSKNDMDSLSIQWLLSNNVIWYDLELNWTIAQSGSYNFLVRVTDNDKAMSQDTIQIDVMNVAPTAKAIAEVQNKGTEVAFKAKVVDTPSDLIKLEYKWDFGDGESKVGRNITHDYGKLGTFTATLTVKDDDGASATASVTVTIDNIPPIIVIDGPIELDEDELGVFKATASDKDGNILSTQWDMGDGTKDEGLTFTHSYPRKGKYGVKFTARDNMGGLTVRSLFVEVQNLDPVAKANWSRVGYVDERMQFDASKSEDTVSDRDGLEFRWSFGDGAKGEGMVVEHTFVKAGEFEVTLNVTDGDHASGIINLMVTIIERSGTNIQTYLAIDIQISPTKVKPSTLINIEGQISLNLPGGIGDILRARDVSVIISTTTGGWSLFETVEANKDGSFGLIIPAPKHPGRYQIKASLRISDLSANDTTMLEVQGSTAAIELHAPATVVVVTTSIGLVGIAAAMAGTDLGRWKFFALLIPLYTRLKKDSVLDHFERGRIFEYIGKNPGAHYSEIKCNLDLNNGALAYHLKVLERENYIKSKALGLYKRFYPFGFRIEMQKHVPIQDLIVGIVRRTPGIGQNEMAKALGVPRSTVNYQCNMLVRSGEIRSEKLGRTKKYWPKKET